MHMHINVCVSILPNLDVMIIPNILSIIFKILTVTPIINISHYSNYSKCVKMIFTVGSFIQEPNKIPQCQLSPLFPAPTPPPVPFLFHATDLLGKPGYLSCRMPHILDLVDSFHGVSLFLQPLYFL